MRNSSRSRVRVLCALALGASLSLSACTAQYQNHGYIPTEEELGTIEVGADTRDSVAAKVGIPASSGVLNDSGYYYVRMRKRAYGPFASREIERQVVAISFSSAGVVQNVERFGLEKGQVVPLQRRVTTSAVGNTSFIRQLLGNIGKFSAAGLGG